MLACTSMAAGQGCDTATSWLQMTPSNGSRAAGAQGSCRSARLLADMPTTVWCPVAPVQQNAAMAARHKALHSPLNLPNASAI